MTKSTQITMMLISIALSTFEAGNALAHEVRSSDKCPSDNPAVGCFKLLSAGATVADIANASEFSRLNLERLLAYNDHWGNVTQDTPIPPGTWIVIRDNKIERSLRKKD